MPKNQELHLQIKIKEKTWVSISFFLSSSYLVEPL